MQSDRDKNELRLFVSSTFRDLMPEREHLVKKVFPRLRKECRDRGVEFTEIDLRWGITEEESRTGKTIRICLKEIDRCRPYFIGILGSRYGWVPGITEVEKDAELLHEFPWLRQYAEGEKSIIEMEFAHGAVLQKNESAFFYEQSPHQNITTVGEAELGSLRKTILATGTPLREFATPEELGEHVFQDIVTILERDFPQKPELTALERERVEHDAFARNRVQSYVADPEYYNIFERRVASTGAPLIIWGKSGLGKSALMAYLAQEYRQQHPEAFVVQHFVGAAEGSDPEDVILQIMMEIKERYSLSDALPTDDNALREEFPVWLAKVHEGDKLILFIDALNQLTGVALEMHWLPDFIPANVRLVLSTTKDSQPLEELRKRRWKELELKPLTEVQRKRIAEDYLERYSKSLPSEELRTLAANPKTSSPLFLRTVLEELRIFGHYSAVNEELGSYLASSDERELFQNVLARMERDYGEQVVRSVFTAIWASRLGLSEVELMDITSLPRMKLSELLLSMEYHLMQREGYFTFFHNYLREAIEFRYVPGEDVRKSAHTRIAEYFSTREFGSRRRDEEPWQWVAAENNEKLKESLLAPGMLALLDDPHHQYEAYSYWRQFDRIALGPEYIPRLMASDESADTIVKAFTNAVELIVLSSNYQQADEFFTAGYPAIANLEMSAERRLRLREKEILVLNYLGKYDDAIERAEHALNEATLTEYPKLHFEILDHICYSYLSQGRFAEGEKILRRAIAESLEHYGARDGDLHTLYNNLGSALLYQSRFDEAGEYFEKAVAIVAENFGATSTEMALALMQVAANLNRLERFDLAAKTFEQAETIYLRTLGPEHWLTCVCRQQFAIALAGLKYFSSARALYISIVEILTKKYGLSHKETVSSGIGIGWTYYLEGNYEKAISYYEKFLPVYAEVYGDDNPETLKRMDRLNEMKEKLRSKNGFEE